MRKYKGTSPIDAFPGYAQFFEYRPEQVFGALVPEVLDAKIIRKRKVKPENVWVFPIYELLANADKPFVGFGLPNAYLAVPDGQGSYSKLNVKSLKRADTTIDTTDLVQAGIQLVFENLPEEGRLALLESMAKVVGQRFETCWIGCATVLMDAGFASGDEPLTSHKLPGDVITSLIRHGLTWRGQSVTFRIVRTSGTDTIERFTLQIKHAELSTFRRHARRNLEKSARTSKMAAAGLYCMNLPAKVLGKRDRANQQYEIAPGLPFGGEYAKAQLSVSMPSAIGMMLRLFWGSHALFQVRPYDAKIEEYLPDVLQAFPVPEPTEENPNPKLSFATRLKKHVLFAKGPVRRILGVLAPTYTAPVERDERDIHSGLRTHTDKHANKYNFVVFSDEEEFDEAADWVLRVSRIQVGLGKINGIVDWILAKHVLMTGWSEKVRFCGEIWKDIDGVVWVSPNSGTYKPKEKQLEAMVRLLQKIMPHVVVKKFSYVDPAAPQPETPTPAAA
jgi:hypothetical protein